MSDFSNVTTPSDLIKLNDQPENDVQSILTEIMTLPAEDAMQIAIVITKTMKDWHEEMATLYMNEGETERVKAWLYDSVVLTNVLDQLQSVAVS